MPQSLVFTVLHSAVGSPVWQKTPMLRDGMRQGKIELTCSSWRSAVFYCVLQIFWFLGISESDKAELSSFLTTQKQENVETGECRKHWKSREFRNLNSAFCIGQNQFGSYRITSSRVRPSHFINPVDNRQTLMKIPVTSWKLNGKDVQKEQAFKWRVWKATCSKVKFAIALVTTCLKGAWQTK